jgi:hypothetical protein
MQGVITRSLVKVRSLLQDSKLLLHVPVKGQENRDRRHEYIAHKGLDQVGEGSRKTMQC